MAFSQVLTWFGLLSAPHSSLFPCAKTPSSLISAPHAQRWQWGVWCSGHLVVGVQGWTTCIFLSWSTRRLLVQSSARSIHPLLLLQDLCLQAPWFWELAGPLVWRCLLVFNIKILDHHGKSTSSFLQTPLVPAGEAGRCDEPPNCTSWPAQADRKPFAIPTAIISSVVPQPTVPEISCWGWGRADLEKSCWCPGLQEHTRGARSPRVGQWSWSPAQLCKLPGTVRQALGKRLCCIVTFPKLAYVGTEAPTALFYFY